MGLLNTPARVLLPRTLLSKALFNRALLKSFLLTSVLLPVQSWADTLEETVSFTIETNPQILISNSRYRASQEVINIERGNYLPKLGVSSSVGIQRKNNRFKTGNTKTTDRKVDTTVSLRQMVFDGFSTQNRVEGARQDSRSRSLMLKARAESLALKVTEVYLRVIRSEQLLELARDNLAVHDEIYDQIHQRTGSGLSRTSDLEQIRSRRARASANLVAAINVLSNARSEYFDLVNRKPADLDMPEMNKEMLPVTLDEAMALAGEKNPVIAAASVDIRAYEARASALDGNFWPKVDLDVGQTWADIDSKIKSSDGRTDELSATLNFSYNIYNGGIDKARKEEAAWKIEEARANRQLTYRNVTRDLRLAWDSFVYMEGQIRYLTEHIEASREVAKAYQQQFRLGKRSLLDLLDTENELFQSQRDFIQVIHEELFSRYRILHNTGQLLEMMSLSLPQIQANTATTAGPLPGP